MNELNDLEKTGDWLRDHAYSDYVTAFETKLTDSTSEFLEDEEIIHRIGVRNRAYKRAMLIETVANMLHPQGKYSPYDRYRDKEGIKRNKIPRELCQLGYEDRKFT